MRLEHCILRKELKLYGFQFHKGAIRTFVSFWGRVLYKDFNSIKVRLELYNKTYELETNTFQFHKGAIRTAIVKFHGLRLQDFNSIKVRLEQTNLNGSHQVSPISIP